MLSSVVFGFIFWGEGAPLRSFLVSGGALCCCVKFCLYFVDVLYSPAIFHVVVFLCVCVALCGSAGEVPGPRGCWRSAPPGLAAAGSR